MNRKTFNSNGPDSSEDQSPGKRFEEQKGWYSRGYIPHLDSTKIIQHISYHLNDSIPQRMLDQIRAEVYESTDGDEERKLEMIQRIDEYLDTGYGCCVLTDPEAAACVVDTWLHFDGIRYRLLEWVVMPNHCHVLIEPFEGVSLGRIVLSWKNYTARWINEHINRPRTAAPQSGTSIENSGITLDSDMQGRSGERRSQPNAYFWHRDYWDRYIRDDKHYLAVCEYIRMNPVKAGLVKKPEDWKWSSANVNTLQDRRSPERH